MSRAGGGAPKDFLEYLGTASEGATIDNIQELKGLMIRQPVTRKGGTTDDQILVEQSTQVLPQEKTQANVEILVLNVTSGRIQIFVVCIIRLVVSLSKILVRNAYPKTSKYPRPKVLK